MPPAILAISVDSAIVDFSVACPNPFCDCPRCAAQRQATAERRAELLEELAAIDEEGAQ